MVKIALLGAPGCGKSTLAAYVYAMLKDTGLDGDLVQEYIRHLINANNKIPNITLQSIVYERQMEKERILPEKLDFFVTDSPHILSYIYAALYINYEDPDQRELLADLYNKFLKYSRSSYDLIYLLDHNHPPKMDDGVRYQTDGEMELLKKAIPAFLDMHRMKYKILPSNLSSLARAEIVATDVKELIREKTILDGIKFPTSKEILEMLNVVENHE